VRSNSRILVVGFIWSGLEASVLVLSVLLLGPSTSFLTSLQLRASSDFPLGWLLIFLIAFGSGVILSDPGETVKATALATFIGVILALLLVYFLKIPFPGSVSQGDAQAAFFGSLALPLLFLGVLGGLLGRIARGWIIPTLRGKPW
jgi:hypothetical protein